MICGNACSLDDKEGVTGLEVCGILLDICITRGVKEVADLVKKVNGLLREKVVGHNERSVLVKFYRVKIGCGIEGVKGNGCDYKTEAVSFACVVIAVLIEIYTLSVLDKSVDRPLAVINEIVKIVRLKLVEIGEEVLIEDNEVHHIKERGSDIAGCEINTVVNGSLGNKALGPPGLVELKDGILGHILKSALNCESCTGHGIATEKIVSIRACLKAVDAGVYEVLLLLVCTGDAKELKGNAELFLNVCVLSEHCVVYRLTVLIFNEEFVLV